MLLRAIKRIAGPLPPNAGPGELFRCEDAEAAALIADGAAEMVPQAGAETPAEPTPETVSPVDAEGQPKGRKGSRFA